jgi:hypothetical protein
MVRLLTMAAALAASGAAAEALPPVIPPEQMTAVQHAVAAEYRRTIHAGPIIFAREWTSQYGQTCGWVTSVNADGYITGWHPFIVIRDGGHPQTPPGGRVLIFRPDSDRITGCD